VPYASAVLKVVPGNFFLMTMRSRILVSTLLAALLAPLSIRGQDGPAPALLGAPLADFTLPVLQGGELSPAQLRGKNLLLFFPRGRVGPDHWCQICSYQYAELAELEAAQHLRAKYNLEVVFVLPYDRALVAEWAAKLPDQLKIIDGWKNPADPAKLDEKGRRWMEFTRRIFPKAVILPPGAAATPFPILVDADRTVSRRFGLFTTEWDHAKIEQNIPMVLIVDPQGVVRFKYVSQNTFDRPDFDYLFRFLERMVIAK